MKRVLLLLLVASLAQAQVQTIQWSKVSGRDTVFMAGSLWGISTKFVTFKDGSYMSSAAGFSDTTKYLEWADSAATAGWVTREKFRLDTTYKAAQLLLRVLYTDSGTTYSSFAQFRDSLANARSRYVWKRDSGIVYASYPQFRDSLVAHWSQLLLRVLYSDTGTTAAKIPRVWYLWNQIQDSLAEYVLRANSVLTGTTTAASIVPSGTSGQFGWWNKPAGWNYITPATPSDTLRIDSVVIIGKTRIRPEAAYHGSPADSYGELLFKTTETGIGNVIAVQNIDSTKYAAYTARDIYGQEKSVFGYGNQNAGGYWSDKSYIEIWPGNLGTPQEFVINHDGNYGSLGTPGTVRFYKRISLAAGTSNFDVWKLIPNNLTQESALHITAITGNVLINSVTDDGLNGLQVNRSARIDSNLSVLTLTPIGTSGRFGWWTRSGGTVSLATSTDTTTLGGLVNFGSGNNANYAVQVNYNGAANNALGIFDNRSQSTGRGGFISLGGNKGAANTQTVFAEVLGQKANSNTNSTSGAFSIFVNRGGAGLGEVLKIDSLYNLIWGGSQFLDGSRNVSAGTISANSGSVTTSVSSFKGTNAKANILELYRSASATAVATVDTNGVPDFPNALVSGVIVGDSVRVAVPGLTTATGDAVVCYRMAASAAPDTLPSFRINAAGYITLTGKHGYTVKAFVGRK